MKQFTSCLSIFISALIISIFSTSCGANDSDKLPAGTFMGDEKDAIAFFSNDFSQIFQMNSIGEISEITSFSKRKETPLVGNKESLIKGICITSEKNSVDATNNELIIVSPDGHILGPLDSDWKPNLSPSGNWLAVACGNDGEGKTIVVANEDSSLPTSDKGNIIDNWSRDRSAATSNLIEIFLLKTDGSALHRLTYNEGGDWLPRWDSTGEFLLIESNRDGQSDIFLHASNFLSYTKLTSEKFQDRSPSWSKDGGFAAYRSGDSESFEIVLVDLDLSIPEIKKQVRTGETGVPTIWPLKP